jgi:hypothetical protein
MCVEDSLPARAAAVSLTRSQVVLWTVCRGSAETSLASLITNLIGGKWLGLLNEATTNINQAAAISAAGSIDFTRPN